MFDLLYQIGLCTCYALDYYVYIKAWEFWCWRTSEAVHLPAQTKQHRLPVRQGFCDPSDHEAWIKEYLGVDKPTYAVKSKLEGSQAEALFNELENELYKASGVDVKGGSEMIKKQEDVIVIGHKDETPSQKEEEDMKGLDGDYTMTGRVVGKSQDWIHFVDGNTRQRRWIKSNGRNRQVELGDLLIIGVRIDEEGQLSAVSVAKLIDPQNKSKAI